MKLPEAIEGAVQRLMADPTAVPTAEEIRAVALTLNTDRLLSVGEAAELTGISAHTLRYYEREGLLGTLRTEHGHRRFDTYALRRLARIAHLRLTGMPIATLKKVAPFLDDLHDPETLKMGIEVLGEHRAVLERKIAELRLSLALTEHKITLAHRRLNKQEGSCVEVPPEL
ncbi:MAG: MerR family transcriptional regulator [Actinomycetaceae bacterium]|nr:MerR family transcriptional regulator [Actinomycetaceae bacterium]MDO4260393.1 MerR family transcriptional regulator [Actinomycetaceae bacterium]